MNQIKFYFCIGKLLFLLLLLFVLTSLSGCSQCENKSNRIVLTFQHQHFALPDGKYNVQVKLDDGKTPFLIRFTGKMSTDVDPKYPNMFCNGLPGCRFGWSALLYWGLPSKVSVVVKLKEKVVLSTSFKPIFSRAVLLCSNTYFASRRLIIPAWE